MVSRRIVSFGLCVLPWVIAPAHADMLDQLRMAAAEPFTFSITPASPLPAAPQEPVNRAPLSAKPAAPANVPADADAKPQGDDAAAKAKRQHDEDAAKAGLHVAPEPEEAAESPADHPAPSEMSRNKADQAGGRYTPVPTDLDAMLKNVTRSRTETQRSAQPAGDASPVAERGAINEPVPVAPPSVITPVAPPPPYAVAAVPPPPPPPPQYPAAVPTYPPQIVVIQPMPYPPPQYVPAPVVVYGWPPQAVGQVSGASGMFAPTYRPMPAYQQEMWRRQAWMQQRWAYQMAQRPVAAYGYAHPGGYRMAWNRPAPRGMWIGGYR